MKKLRKRAFLYICIAYCKSAHCLTYALPLPHRSLDPNKLARKLLNNGVPTFPFFTIENPADDNELILLEVGDFLKAN